jgi:hypothetical protein
VDVLDSSSTSMVEEQAHARTLHQKAVPDLKIHDTLFESVDVTHT